MLKAASSSPKKFKSIHMKNSNLSNIKINLPKNLIKHHNLWFHINPLKIPLTHSKKNPFNYKTFSRTSTVIK